MAKPTPTGTDLKWASNANYSAGALPGTPTKTEPLPGQKNDGWRPADEPDAQGWNWWNHHMADWTRYLYDDAWSIQHEDDGDHSSEVITRVHLKSGSNVLPNPTGSAGLKKWTVAGAGAVWQATTDTNPAGSGPMFSCGSIDAGSKTLTSDAIAIGDNLNMIVSAEFNTSFNSYISGHTRLRIDAYIGGAVQGSLGSITKTASTSGWESEYTAIDTSDFAGTDNIKIVLAQTLSAGAASTGAIRNIQPERDTLPSVFDDKQNINIAEKVLIDDTSGYFAADDVEAAFEELADGTALQTDAIDTLNIQDDAVTTDKIVNTSVTPAKLNIAGGENYHYESVKTLIYTAGAGDFIREGGANSLLIFPGATNLGVLAADSLDYFAYASLHLPEGAEIISIIMAYERAVAATPIIEAFVARITKTTPPAVPAKTTFLTLTSDSDGYNEKSSGAISEVIDNAGKYYTIEVRLNNNGTASGAKLYFFEITYEITNLLPVG